MTNVVVMENRFLSEAIPAPFLKNKMHLTQSKPRTQRKTGEGDERDGCLLRPRFMFWVLGFNLKPQTGNFKLSPITFQSSRYL